jgi:hypothetical protein
MVSNTVEDQVITLPALGEILLGIVNDPIRADGSDHVHIPTAAHAGYICAEPLGNLHSERTHASRRTVDQHPLPRLNASAVAKTLQCCECRDTYGSRLLERNVVGFQRYRRFGRANILREGSTARTEHVVARFELRYVPANGFNLASHVNAQASVLWFAKPGQYAKEVRGASHKVPVQWIYGSGADPDQDLIVTNARFLDVFDA